MPGDTKIKRTANGWIDVDVPTNYFGARRLARDARRIRLTSNRPAFKLSPPKPQDSLTGLQDRLLTRLTQRQGVARDEALAVIKNNGYNKAASYGHMREAGANHSEATIVVDLELPDVSLAYGIARSSGEDHSAALRKALLSDYDD